MTCSLSRPCGLVLAVTLATVTPLALGQPTPPAGAPSVQDAARQAPEHCPSVVFVDCNGPASQAARPAAPTGAGARLRARRSLVAGSGEDEGGDSGNVIVTAERPLHAQEEKWLRFHEAVGAAAIPSCYHVGSGLGLLAVPVLPLMAATGKCH
jgi:hypothetical protein